MLSRLRGRAEAVARAFPRTVVRRPRGNRDVHARHARRRPDRDRGLARRRQGRHRPVSLTAEIQKVAKQYPESKSAVLPALRLAQEQYGWLSRDAFEEVADA